VRITPRPSHIENMLGLQIIAVLEIVASLSVFFLTTWIFGPAVESPIDGLFYLCLLGLAGTYVLIRTRLQIVEWLSMPLRPGLLQYVTVTVAGLTLMRLIGQPPASGWYSLLAFSLLYLPLAVAQAVWLYAFLWPRILLLVCRGSHPVSPIYPALILCGIFSAIHAPNFPLMFCTAIVGFVWSRIFYSHANPILLALSHACLATGYQHLLIWSSRVGPGYLNPNHHAMRKSIDLAQQLFHQAFQ
jgi:hypothetical protein